MPTACCVIGCKSRGNGPSGVQFFQLPLNKPKILTQWLIVLDRRDWIPKPSSKICSLHFSSDDYVMRPNTNAPRLKPDAIPSVFPDLSNSQDEKEASPVKPKEETYAAKENKIKPRETLFKMATPVVSESPSGRPRRVSKLNSKMKDYILLDDIKKHRKNTFHSSRPQPSDKEKAAQELLSILEDSSSLSGDESTGKFNKHAALNSSTKANSGIKFTSVNYSASPSATSRSNSLSKVITPNDVSKEKSQKPTIVPICSSPPKLAPLNNLSSKGTLKSSEKTLNSISKLSVEDVTLPELVPISRKVASKSTGGKRVKGKGLELVRSKGMGRGEKVSMQDSLNSISNRNEKNKSVLAKSKVMNKNDTTGFISKSSHESSVPKKGLPHAFRKTYFQVNEGDKSYYFSYADLNPFVDLTKENALHDKNPLILDDEITDEGNDRGDFDDADEMVPLDGDLEESIRLDDSDENPDVLPYLEEPSIVETPPATTKRTYKKRQQGKKGQKGSVNIKLTSRKELKKGPRKNRLKDINENSPVNDTSVDEAVLGDAAVDEAGSDKPVDENTILTVRDNIPAKIIAEKGMTSPTMSKVSKNFKVTSPVKRKKRFKTVAEIVVRTDNTGQVPSVSIDKINNLVDIESETPPRKKTKRAKTTNEPVMTKLSEETELDRLSQRITDTIKKMKLLEKVKGNTSKLTVLITTLPPVQEKEILIIKKKNLETNVEQSRELQVAISNYKTLDETMNGSGHVLSPNSNASLPPFIHLDVPILGACNNDTIIEESVTCTVNEETSSSREKVLQNEIAVVAAGNKKSSLNQSEGGSVPCDEVTPLTVELSSENSTAQAANDPDAIVHTAEGDNISDAVGESASTSTCERNGEMHKGVQIEPTVPLQHDHTYMTVITPAVVMTEGESNSGAEPAKDVFSKLKLSDLEISFRTKVSQKIRNLKENVKRKSETIGKLKQKLKYLERTMKDERQTQTKQRIAVKPRKAVIETNTLYDNIIENNELTKSINYNLNSGVMPLEFEENLESEEEERACSSPITYLCEPAIDVCEKPNADD